MTDLWAPAQLITASKLNKGVAFRVASLTALRAINTTLYTEDNLPFFVDGNGVFLYKIAGTGSDDGINTIVPTAGSGVYIKLIGGGFTEKFADGTALKAFNTTNLSSGLYYEAQITQQGRVWKYFWVPSGTAPLAEPYNYTPTSGPGYWALLSREVASFLPSDTQVFVNKSSHGFTTLNVIRYSGGTWSKAQANTEAGCVSCWIVSTVLDANNFVAVKVGRVTVPSHGLTPGATYYLSAASAGALTATIPVGSTTVPLGFYLPAVYVVDADNIDVLGQAQATINPLLAEWIVGGSNETQVTFSNLNANANGGTIDFEFSCSQVGTSGTSNFSMRINGVTTNNYSGCAYFYNGSAWTRAPIGSTEAILARHNTSGGAGMTCDGTIKLQGTGSRLVDWNTRSTSASSTSPNADIGIAGGRLMAAQTNITSVLFNASSYTFAANTGNYIRLYRKH